MIHVILNTMSNTIKDIRYSNKVNCDFSETLYQKMASKRFGITFCCKKDFKKHVIDKELLMLNNMLDEELTPVVCEE